ncbi:hypothetical protein S7711_08545 [Stachybotrys chartarum IBT 7711]|uniref:SH3 domain-containing protein n=1 Tax=Stachybotrys chartarum (strain CBS 109288 / IBT 7711) TaxID=1280523 RepID=A0A084B1C0_STACB|nr:hypothetical protein S7711_08545 [Stachybotrys chartarum IBT 7711]
MPNFPSHLHRRVEERNVGNMPAMNKRQDPPAAITSVERPPSTETVLQQATGTIAPTAGLASETTSISAEATETSEPTSGNSGNGNDVAVTAGIAFGVLGGVLIIALLLYFIISRRRRQARERSKQADKEKNASASRSAQAAAATKDAPKPAHTMNLSADFSTPGNLNKPLPSPAYSAVEHETNGPGEGNAWLYPRNNRNSTYSNPFDNEMATVSSLNTDERSIYTRNRSPSPISINDAFPERPITRFMPGVAPAPAPLTRKASLRKDVSHGKPAQDMTPGLAITSPFGNEYAVGAAAPGNESAAHPADGPVYRAQLDFEPSLDDEMELRAGDLVRVVHEFDDGWALCKRIGGSREGIVPRTCLSSNPVRPRQ